MKGLGFRVSVQETELGDWSAEKEQWCFREAPRDAGPCLGPGLGARSGCLTMFKIFTKVFSESVCARARFFASDLTYVPHQLLESTKQRDIRTYLPLVFPPTRSYLVSILRALIFPEGDYPGGRPHRRGVHCCSAARIVYIYICIYTCIYVYIYRVTPPPRTNL